MTYRDYLIYIHTYIYTTRWTNVKPLTEKITVFLKWVQHLHFSCDMALMWSHFPKLIQKGVDAWAHLHPRSGKRSVKLEATHGWQQSFFLSLWSFQAGSMLSAKVVVFRAASSLSLRCRYHRVLQGDGWLLKQAAQAVPRLGQWLRTELAISGQWWWLLQHWQSTGCRNRRVATLHDKF